MNFYTEFGSSEDFERELNVRRPLKTYKYNFPNKNDNIITKKIKPALQNIEPQTKYLSDRMSKSVLRFSVY